MVGESHEKELVNGMFDKLRQFLEEMTGPDPGEREFGESDFRLAAAALLVHVAEIDGFFDPAERRALLLLLQQRFDLDAGAAGRLLAAAQKATAKPWTFTASPRSCSSP